MLVCLHDFQRVACGPDGKGWVKAFFKTFGPVVKIGLFAARAALLASSAGAAIALPFLPQRPRGPDADGCLANSPNLPPSIYAAFQMMFYSHDAEL